MAQYTYDAYVNDTLKTGITLTQLSAYKNKGYKVVVINKYIVSDNDYNSIAIKNTYY